MKTHTLFAALCAVISTITLTGVARADDLLIPKGTVIPVALIEDISTANIKAGDTIKAVYTGDTDGGFPEGTIFVAHVQSANAKTAKTSGSIALMFTGVTLPNGKTLTIQGKPVDLKTTGGKNKKKSTGTGAAIGAGAGVLVAGHNATGALLGGAAGAMLGNKKGSKAQELTLKKGSPFGIELQASAKVPEAAATKKP